MVRKVNNRLYKINTYASAHIIEIDDNYDEEVQKLRKEIQLDNLGYKLTCISCHINGTRLCNFKCNGI